MTTTSPTALPPLDVDCPDCTSPEYAAARDQSIADWNTWHERESSAYNAWIAQRTADGVPFPHDHETWKTTDAYSALGPEPDVLPEIGCVECDWTGRKVTDEGRVLLAFLIRHGVKA